MQIVSSNAAVTADHRAAAHALVQVEGDLPAISVIGLGYVGAVSIACLSALGFRMVGVDVSL
ncbi:MAG: hypothetical protein KGP27_11795 [Hyphomicrobiales bacterium]|nr:hypothetical protein [Hyphomicrobiales bacterium]